METKQEILALLQAFQDGYTRRDVSQVDTFMELFTKDVEIIGTNGVKPGVDEWYVDNASAQELVEGDWQGWGDLKLDLENASIKVNGDVGWIAVSATVSTIIGTENYDSYLQNIRKFIDTSDLPAEQKLHFILRGGTNTVYELHRGDHFVWPLRLTAVVVHKEEWKFAQVNFSFPTVYFPDVRVLA
jgi:hypothetical protein